MRSPEAPPPHPTPGAAAWIAFAGAGGLVCVVISLWRAHPVQYDEVEFFRATDWIRRGAVPYRDFWEHHTPLFWYVFAPVSMLARSPGTGAIVAMRFLQLPLWIGTFFLLYLMMRRAQISSLAAAAALLLALVSSSMQEQIVEYRVDVLSTTLYLLAVVLAMRMRERLAYAVAAGAVFALVVLANLRVAPLVVVTMLLLRVVSPDRRQWSGPVRAYAMIHGAAAVAVAWFVYLIATRSLRIAWQRLIVDNYVGEARVSVNPGALGYAVAEAWGWRIDAWRRIFCWQLIDPAAMAFWIVGSSVAVVLLVRRGRRPDWLCVLAILQLANILFVTRMKLIHTYHFQIVFALAIPFVAAGFDMVRARSRAATPIVAVLIGVTLFQALALTFMRSGAATMRYQDLIMKEADRRTSSSDRVFSGFGWALRREPAYEYWFLPLLVRVMNEAGRFSPYRAEEMAMAPPRVVVVDYFVRMYLRHEPGLARQVVSHDLPLWRNLWIPALSGRLDMTTPDAEWIVPIDGTYRVFASANLSSHPWFREPLAASATSGPLDLRRLPSTAPGAIDWTIDGTHAAIGVRVNLRKGVRLRASLRARTAFGVFLVPGDDETLFRQPSPGVDFDPDRSFR